RNLSPLGELEGQNSSLEQCRRRGGPRQAEETPARPPGFGARRSGAPFRSGPAIQLSKNHPAKTSCELTPPSSIGLDCHCDNASVKLSLDFSSAKWFYRLSRWLE